MHAEPSHWLHETFIFQNCLLLFLGSANRRGTNCGTVLCETKREFSAANCTMWCAHICSDVGDVRCNIKYRANNKFLDIGKCTKMSYSTQAFVGLAYQGEDLVFRFIIVCSSLKDFGP